jgi:hypothetical protein
VLHLKNLAHKLHHHMLLVGPSISVMRLKEQAEHNMLHMKSNCHCFAQISYAGIANLSQNILLQ